MNKEREALKLALVLIESSVLHCDAELNENDVADITKQVREALAQPEQDVDYWIKQHTEARQAERELRRELESLKPEQEPVARFDENDLIESLGTVTFLAHQGQQLKNGDKLYTTPPKHEWVGLTASDMRYISLICIDKVDAMLMTEDKLKELNHD